ncbi:MAG: 4Fe-4S binding protein [Methanomassiliicoccales archaeon]
MKVIIEKCMHCGACVGSCPSNAIFLNEVIIDFHQECNQCRRCTKACPVGAIQMEAGG